MVSVFQGKTKLSWPYVARRQDGSHSLQEVRVGLGQKKVNAWDTFNKAMANWMSLTGSNEATSRPVGLSIKNLTKLYPSSTARLPAIYDLSLDLYEGQVTTLLGRNGAGKTTAM